MVAFQKHGAEWSAKEGAYAYLHATKPFTAGLRAQRFTDGLCAWIVEKFN